MNQFPQQYQAQLLQEIISVVLALSVMAIVISNAIRAIKEAVRR